MNWAVDRPKTVWFSFGASFGHFLGVDEVASTPVALHESPSACHVHGIPRIPESWIFKSDAGLVTGRFRVTFDHDAMQPSIAVKRESRINRLRPKWSNQNVSPLLQEEKHGFKIPLMRENRPVFFCFFLNIRIISVREGRILFTYGYWKVLAISRFLGCISYPSSKFITVNGLTIYNRAGLLPWASLRWCSAWLRPSLMALMWPLGDSNCCRWEATSGLTTVWLSKLRFSLANLQSRLKRTW